MTGDLELDRALETAITGGEEAVLELLGELEGGQLARAVAALEPVPGLPGSEMPRLLADGRPGTTKGERS
jgi:hypothetical protein